MMADWDPDLRRRQAAKPRSEADLMAAALTDGAGYGSVGSGLTRWRPLLLPLGLVVVGLLLGLFSPLPGLGMFMVIGGAFATPMIALQIFLGA